MNEILWQNRLAENVWGPMDARAGRPRNVAWRWFTDPDVRGRFPEEDWPRHSAARVNDLRATSSRRHGDPDVTALVHDLLESSAEFRTLWEKHEVSVRRYDRKNVVYPEVGLLHLNCEAVNSANRDASVYTDAETFNPDRPERAHLGFGHGAHFCIGASLARTELRVVFATLARRLPGLRLAKQLDELEVRPTITGGVTALPVTW